MRPFSFLPRLGWLCGLALLLAGCVEPYMPEAITSPPSYLVVDGFINSQGVTSIKLTRTFAVAAKNAAPAETGAMVYVEEEGGARIPLFETAVKGTYASASSGLDVSKRYRLHLSTRGGQEYASEYVPVKTTPVIDNLQWQATGNGLYVYVNSHDDRNATQYYRWEYDETWEISTPYNPVVEYVGGQFRPITVPFPPVCYSTAHGSSIEISKTTSLSQDVVANYPVRNLPTTSTALLRRYSILVQQHALTREEYEYWDLLRKNTEKIGTLFDPQPSQLTGNVRSLNNPADLALGFVGAHSVTDKRIIIGRNELPKEWIMPSGYESCIPADTVTRPFYQQLFGSGILVPIEPVFSSTGFILGYYGATPACVDCRKRGTAIKPSYWP